MSSPPPESGLENQAEATPNSGHRKEAEASPESGHGKEEEEVVINPVKPEAAAAEEKGGGVHINIKIMSQTAPDVLIRVKRDVTMQFILEKYCGKHSLVPKAVLFLNDHGEHFRDLQMAEEAGLKDGSTISVHLRVDGGSGRSSV